MKCLVRASTDLLTYTVILPYYLQYGKRHVSDVTRQDPRWCASGLESLSEPFLIPVIVQEIIKIITTRRKEDHRDLPILCVAELPQPKRTEVHDKSYFSTDQS